MSAVEYSYYMRQYREAQATLEALLKRIRSKDYSDHHELSGIASSVHTVRGQIAWLEEKIA